MSAVIRTDEEFYAMQRRVCRAMDDGVEGAELVMNVLAWLNEPSYPEPEFKAE